jgi:hypothetical protein
MQHIAHSGALASQRQRVQARKTWPPAALLAIGVRPSIIGMAGSKVHCPPQPSTIDAQVDRPARRRGELGRANGEGQPVDDPGRQVAGERRRQVAAGGTEIAGETCEQPVSRRCNRWPDRAHR